MNEKWQDHLIHLLFNDWVWCCENGMNQNAADRSCMIDAFEKDIASENFDFLFAKQAAKYEMNIAEIVRLNAAAVEAIMWMGERVEFDAEKNAKEYAQRYLEWREKKIGEIK